MEFLQGSFSLVSPVQNETQEWWRANSTAWLLWYQWLPPLEKKPCSTGTSITVELQTESSWLCLGVLTWSWTETGTGNWKPKSLHERSHSNSPASFDSHRNSPGAQSSLHPSMLAHQVALMVASKVPGSCCTGTGTNAVIATLGLVLLTWSTVL